MAYFIYNKSGEQCIYKIAENDVDLNCLIVPQDQYNIVNANQEDFNSVKLNTKCILNFNGSSPQLENCSIIFNRVNLISYINGLKFQIQQFLNAQPQNPKYVLWNNYLIYLNSLNVFTIIPQKDGILESSLEQYIQSTGYSFYNILQIP